MDIDTGFGKQVVEATSMGEIRVTEKRSTIMAVAQNLKIKAKTALSQRKKHAKIKLKKRKISREICQKEGTETNLSGKHAARDLVLSNHLII